MQNKIAVSTACLFLQSLCAPRIASARARAKTVFGNLKPSIENENASCAGLMVSALKPQIRRRTLCLFVEKIFHSHSSHTSPGV